MMRILVTGGAGFIGRHLVGTLTNQGFSVRVLDNLIQQVHGPCPEIPAELHGAEFVLGDVCNPSDIERALVDVDAIVHLAAQTGVGQSMYEIDRYVETNTMGTARLLQALADSEHSIQKLVLASSRAVYGEGLYLCSQCGEVSPSGRHIDDLTRSHWNPACPKCGNTIDPVPTHEDAPLMPQSIYGITKQSQEHLCLNVASAYEIPTIVLRFFNVYGPGQSLVNPYTGILSAFYSRIVQGNAIEVYEDGLESRDFVYIDDVVDAILRALLAPERLPHHIFNVASGVSVCLDDLARMVIAASGSPISFYHSGAYRVGDIRHARADTGRAERELNFKARTSLADGLSEWVAWAKNCNQHSRMEIAERELLERGLYRHNSQPDAATR